MHFKGVTLFATLTVVLFLQLQSVFPQKCQNNTSIPSLQSLDEWKEQIIRSLESGQRLVEKVKKNEFDVAMNKLSSWGVMLIQATGLFFRAFAGKVPNISTKNLIYVQEQFTQLNHDMDFVDAEFSEVKSMVKWNNAKLGFGEYETSINALQDLLMNVVDSPENAKSTLLEHFTKMQEMSFQDSATQIYTGMMHKELKAESPLGGVRVATRDHRRKVQKFVMGIVNLLLKGMQLEVAFMSFKGYSENTVDYWLCTWSERFQELSQQMLLMDGEIRDKWYAQMKEDVDAFNERHHSLDNKEYAGLLQDYLDDKFPQRVWFTMVYNPISGPHDHFSVTCWGHTQLKMRNHNVVVASADRAARKLFDLKRTEEVMNGLPTALASWKHDPAEQLVRKIGKTLPLDCMSVSLIAAVNLGSGLWFYDTEEGRVAYKMWSGTYNRVVPLKKNLNLLVFG